MKTPWDSPLKSDLVLFGNLPFNVATPFLIKLMKTMADQTNLFSFGRMTSVLTFQHEVALRMVAPPANPERCRLSVIVQNWADVHYAFNLPGKTVSVFCLNRCLPKGRKVGIPLEILPHVQE